MIQLTAVEREGRAEDLAAIVLAAGGSVRMGQPKQLLPIDGQPMVRRVTRVVAAAGMAQVVVVIGAHAETVAAALADLPIDVVTNESWTEGMSSSIRTGLRALRPEIQAALLVLADQPALTTDLVHQLVSHYRATGASIVAPFYRGQRGNPVLFDRALFPDLLAVEGDRGGRMVIARHQEHVEGIDVDDPAVITDLDSPEDYERTWKV